MRVLIINKFLYPNGGSETYIFKLGEALEQHGHEVQYFGMEHEGRCVGNRVNAYLKKAILECIANPDEVTRRGKNARKKAEKYTWQEKNEKYQAIYEELLKV